MRAWKTIAVLALLCTLAQPSYGIEFEPFSLDALGRALGIGCGDGYHARPCAKLKSYYYDQVTACGQPFGQSDCGLESYDHTHPNKFWQYPMQQQAPCGCSSCMGDSMFGESEYGDSMYGDLEMNGDSSDDSTLIQSPLDNENDESDSSGADTDAANTNDDVDTKAKRMELENKLKKLQDSIKGPEDLPDPASELQPPTKGVKNFESFGGNTDFLPPKKRPEYSVPAPGDSTHRTATRPIHQQINWQQPVSRATAKTKTNEPVWIRNLAPAPRRVMRPQSAQPAQQPRATRSVPQPPVPPRFRAAPPMPMQFNGYPQTQRPQMRRPQPHRPQPHRPQPHRPAPHYPRGTHPPTYRGPMSVPVKHPVRTQFQPQNARPVQY